MLVLLLHMVVVLLLTLQCRVVVLRCAISHPGVVIVSLVWIPRPGPHLRCHRVAWIHSWRNYSRLVPFVIGKVKPVNCRSLTIHLGKKRSAFGYIVNVIAGLVKL